MTTGSIEHLIVILFLILFIVFTEIKNFKERKSLMDRIMSKSYEEYSNHETYKEQIKAKIKEPHKDQEYVSL